MPNLIKGDRNAVKTGLMTEEVLNARSLAPKSPEKGGIREV
jgi:hypothetical protein